MLVLLSKCVIRLWYNESNGEVPVLFLLLNNKKLSCLLFVKVTKTHHKAKLIADALVWWVVC